MNDAFIKEIMADADEWFTSTSLEELAAIARRGAGNRRDFERKRGAKMSGYDDIKQMAKESGAKVTDLLALAPQNDPFYAGSVATVEAAEWFADLWRRFGYTNGVHLRRVHYRLVNGEKDPRKHNGLPYENTENDWTYLCSAGKYARYLRLIDPLDFVDRRNPEPHVFNVGSDSEQEPSYEIADPSWSLPSVDLNLSASVTLPYPHVYGYDYSQSDQPYYVELWAEKSTMDDVLLPLGRELGVNVVTSLGFQSITSIIALLRRIEQADKPARIFYISDFDPAGDGMPVAVARQLEYWLQDYAPGADIALTPLVLTREQVKHYQLPRIPIKDKDRRKAHFEEHYGEGATELDALEAIYPGELERIIREAVAPYRDAELSNALSEAEAEAQEAVEAAWNDAIGQYQPDLSEIAEKARTVAKSYQARLEGLREKMDAELAPLQERLDSLRQAIITARDDLEIDLPERPEADTDQPDEDDFLYRSDREYLDQLEVYHARKNGDA